MPAYTESTFLTQAVHPRGSQSAPLQQPREQFTPLFHNEELHQRKPAKHFYILSWQTSLLYMNGREHYILNSKNSGYFDEATFWCQKNIKQKN